MNDHARELYDGPSLHQNEVYVCAADGQEWPCRTRLKERIERLTEMLTVISLDVGCQCLEGTGADDGHHTSWFCIHMTEALDIAEGKS